ncbi:hypothetical protein STTU_1825 [Streptomyces sp. Tu6071]|nr:hypothetical protein STTU_1825 [Streptomyces sp. Tu6071]
MPGPAQVTGECVERAQGFGEYGPDGESSDGLHVAAFASGS